MANCSDEFPTTDVLYHEISGDVSKISFMALGCVLAFITVVMHVEIVVYMKRAGYTRYRPHYKQRCLLVGLFPVICVLSVISLLIPTSTTLVDLFIACYISWCIFTFVQMTIDYYGGESTMIRTFAEEKIRLTTPPCCCVLGLCLKPVALTRKSLRVLKIFSMQVAYVRPFLLFVAAILWTDGKYKENLQLDSSYLYIEAISVVSTLLSIYGMIVLFRASRQRLRENCYLVKFIVLQSTVIIANLQSFIFTVLARRGIPGCNGSRGTRVRGSSLNHSIMVIESFLLCLLARYGYRRMEPHLDMLHKHERAVTNIQAKTIFDGLSAEKKTPYGACENSGISEMTKDEV